MADVLASSVSGDAEARTPAVLVVEDDPLIRRLMNKLLTRDGIYCRGVNSAENALEVLQSFRPDLIVMDICLPGMDGMTLTRRIKRKENLHTVPVVAMTSYNEPGDREFFLMGGCDGYIPKPVDPDTFPGLVRGYMEGVTIPTAS